MTDPEIIDAEATAIVFKGHGGISLAPAEQQGAALEKYDRDRKSFLGWLGDHFQQGVHYGVPPGCEPRTGDSVQWRHKPSLYDAGARLFMDLGKVRAEYESDLGAWQMMGSRANVVCRKCKLVSPAGETVGEGSGVFVVGEKRMSENSALKMADKRARVAAVLDAFPFARELFTQDLDEIGSPLDKLRAHVAELRPDATDNDDWLARVAGAVLYGKTVITTRREAEVVGAAIDAGQFDLASGERTVAGTPPSPAPEPRLPVGALNAFLARVNKRREKCESTLTGMQFLEIVMATELDGVTAFEALTQSQYAQINAALRAGKYDWETGQKLP